MRPTETVTSPGGSEVAPADRPRRRRALLVGAAALVVLVAVALWLFLPAGTPPLTRADVDQAVQRGVEQAQEVERNAPPDATVAFQAIAPSLVTVTAQLPGAALSDGGLGSGVVINGDGSVLTALHVVEGAGQVQVAFADGTTAAARVVAAQPAEDIAVLAVDRLPEMVVPAVLAGPPTVGEAVFAVGNPLGLTASLSAGVVSGAERSISTDRGTTIDGLIQFDAAVNPGNSGGPLLNSAGQVVGIVTALANPAHQDFFVGIGFAVPIATAGGAAGGPQQ
ncbi:S1C family serine protease [Pseudonocardia humida]|uniref:Trypsin-like peptidase domain-containing protein n=1 Tax=Pseudonocardia humida TaxID=2800819 RepID=A0ABT1A9Q0_9PSEU|nr:trypsin-like peptidase domain-containing protein [Pseudonocardia humida]MCO1659676.1 trypsin-like peptidase domain-containing protein [Pseudonocardia humida]